VRISSMVSGQSAARLRPRAPSQGKRGVARGAQLPEIQAKGLLLRTPEKTARARFPCVADPTEISFRLDDAILLTMKTQDTVATTSR